MSDNDSISISSEQVIGFIGRLVSAGWVQLDGIHCLTFAQSNKVVLLALGRDKNRREAIDYIILEDTDER